MTGPVGVPGSTYRLQIRQQFPLADAAGLTDYLAALGVQAIYLSPILQATSGSDHGYDITSHSKVDPERGGEQGRLALAEAARQLGLQTVVDIVPNHMGVADAAQNHAWWQLLRQGPDSEYAAWFDVDWQAGNGRIKLPVLGDDAGDDQLSVSLTATSGELRYFEHRFPIAEGTAGPGDSAADVHARQHYELISYRRADNEQNYRRFFAVTELAGIRVEDPSVFDASHAEILRWVRAGDVQGIRIDHPDGLADPAGYLHRLAAAAPDSWITVEKITEPGERLPLDWPVAGTTGYDALAEVNNLLYDPAAELSVSRRYAELTGDHRTWAEHLEQGKRMVADTILHAELLRISRGVRAAAPDLASTDEQVVAALTELAVAFGVYRSYQPVGGEQLAEAAALALSRKPELAGAITELTPLLSARDGEAGREVTVRFEQASGAIMAKGVEDTAYYRYNRAVGLNEVGGDPGGFGCTLAEFHAAQLQRQQLLPDSMTTLSTHDTKRSEDVRARLAVLPELGERWYGVAGQLLAGNPIPQPAFGYLLWQSFAGAGWIERARMHAYAEKAMREASDGTSWRDPDAAFEAAVHQAVDRAYDDPDTHRLLDELIDEITPHGWSNSLSQKLVQLSMPGVPDVYQGTELYDYSLVDPDNRRPVDFELRRRLLAGFDGGPGSDAGPPLEHTGAAKLWLTSRVLRERRAHPERFGSYLPLIVSGPAAEHAVAFDRGGAVTVATRLPVGLQKTGGWQDTVLELGPGAYQDQLTGEQYQGQVPLAVLLRRYPVAFLTRGTD